MEETIATRNLPATRRRAVAWTLLLLIVAGAGAGLYYRFVLYGPWYKAQQALAAYDFVQARADLKQCLERKPDDPEIQLLLARTCRRMGDIPAARTYLEEVSRNQQKPEDVQLEKSLLLVQTDVLRGERDAQRRLAAAPAETPLIVEAIVQGYLASGFLDKAYQVVTGWVNNAPGEWYPRYLRAVVAAAFHGSDPAQMAFVINDLKGVLQRKPNHPEIHLAMAELLRYSSLERDAIPHYEFYLNARPDEANAVAALARCRRAVGEVEQGRHGLDNWLQGHPQINDAELFRIRGQLALDEKKLPEASEWLLRSYRLAKKSPETLQLLASVSRLQKENSKADKYQKEKIACEQDLALVRKLTKEISEAGKNEAGQADPGKLVDLYYQLGSALARLDQHAAGVNSLRVGLRINPGHLPTRRLLHELLTTKQANRGNQPAGDELKGTRP